MREILFRGKTETGEWLKGHLHKIDGIGKGYTAYAIQVQDINTRMCRPHSHEVIPETVGQFTGLTDKNGKKIFEGDIIKEKNYIGVAVIAYDCASFVYKKAEYLNANWYCGECIDDNENGFIGDWVEVIGNIYDNPELLEVNQ